MHFSALFYGHAKLDDLRKIMHPYLPKLYITVTEICSSLFTNVLHCYLPITPNRSTGIHSNYEPHL